jgi:hypothetical protein
MFCPCSIGFEYDGQLSPAFAPYTVGFALNVEQMMSVDVMLPGGDGGNAIGARKAVFM